MSRAPQRRAQRQSHSPACRRQKSGTGSSGSRVGPAVTRACRPLRFIFGDSTLNFAHDHRHIRQAPGPNSPRPSGRHPSTPSHRPRAGGRHCFVAACSHPHIHRRTISRLNGGEQRGGGGHRETIRGLRHRSAVAGQTITRSAERDSSICPISVSSVRSNSSEKTFAGDAAKRVTTRASLQDHARGNAATAQLADQPRLIGRDAAANIRGCV